MDYCVMAGFSIMRDFEELADAERAFDEMVRDGYSYVELTKVTRFAGFDKYESIKIHW